MPAPERDALDWALDSVRHDVMCRCYKYIDECDCIVGKARAQAGRLREENVTMLDMLRNIWAKAHEHGEVRVSSAELNRMLVTCDPIRREHEHVRDAIREQRRREIEQAAFARQPKEET